MVPVPAVPAHPGLAGGRWIELSLAEQLANIGSEVSRSIHAKESGNEVRFQRAFERCLDLFDLTLADERWHGRRREVARAREVVCDFLGGDNAYRSTAAWLDGYFLAFAARRDTSPRPVEISETDPRVNALIGSSWSGRIEALAAGILGGLPAGPFLAAALGEIGRRRERRLTAFVVEVEDRVTTLETGEPLDRAHLRSDELQDYYLRVLELVAETSQADKYHYFAAALANSLTHASLGSTERDSMLGILGDLQLPQLRLLASLTRVRLDAPAVEYFTPGTAAAQVLDVALPDVPASLRRRLWEQMSDFGLLDSTLQLLTTEQSLPEEEQDGVLTAFGQTFIDFITTPESARGANSSFATSRGQP